jgi:hypothetical protein
MPINLHQLLQFDDFFVFLTVAFEAKQSNKMHASTVTV